jgi:hypothetical protein
LAKLARLKFQKPKDSVLNPKFSEQEGNHKDVRRGSDAQEKKICMFQYYLEREREREISFPLL